MDIDVIPRSTRHPAPTTELRTSDRPERIIGLLVLLVAFGGFGLWAAFAPIDSAAVAPGVVAVESSRKTIQHLDGGVVKEIRVREGDRVNAGDALVKLDDTEARAQFEIVRTQYLAQRAEEARLIAERDDRPEIAFPKDLLDASADPRVEEAMTGQKRVFEARRKALDGDIAVLRQRIDQYNEQIVGLEALFKSKSKRIDLYQEEIGGLKALFAKGMGDKSRLREYERLVAELEGEQGDHQAAIAGAKVQIGEAELQIGQQKRKFESDVVEQLRDVQTKLSDQRERTRALEKTLERTLVTAPVGGHVVGMKVHTIGGVVRPGDPLLEIIPQDEALIVEARVRPLDIDKVIPGLEAQIRFTAFNTRTTPTVSGRVLTVSADRLVDQATNAPYYLARIQVTPEGKEALKGLTLLPGMPAEAMIKLGERTFFDYLIRPLTDRVSHAFRDK